MPRPPRYDVDLLLDAAAGLAAAAGPAGVTMTAVARAAGAPSGSVYHRFADRSALLAALWLRTLHRFQAGWLTALNSDPPVEAAVRAARHVVEWSRGNPEQAAVLLAGARAFGSHEWTEQQTAAAGAAQGALVAAIRRAGRRLALRRAADRERLVLAVIDVPYAVVRRHLVAGRTIPKHAADVVERAARALLV